MLSTEEFEELARAAPETVWLEFIDGELEVKPALDGDQGTIVMWLLEQCMQQRAELRLYPQQGLQTERHRSGRARPDGSLAPEDHFAGQGEWADPEGVLMTVGVASRDCKKRDGYAAVDIPVHLLVDRDEEMVTVYSEPRNGKYLSRKSHPYGETVTLPDPVGVTLATEKLKDYTHWRPSGDPQPRKEQ